MRFAPLVLVTFLAGCVTITALKSPSTGQLVEAGMTKEQVVAAWGEPERSSTIDSRIILETDIWEYEFAVVYFIQGDVVEKVMPRGR